MTEQQILIKNILSFIESNDSSEESFNQLALNLFRYQYSQNAPFRTFCMQKGKTPRTIRSWKDIPAVPINAFKECTLSCTDPDLAERIFMTSGTTKGISGKHFHPTTEVYDRSMLVNFKKRVMGDTERIRMGILFPTEEVMPNSSLAHYLALALREFGTQDSHYLMGDEGILVDRLIEELERAERTGEPYALLGASFSFVHMFEELERRGTLFSLPQGSKVLDTGGFKNQSRELELDEFYALLSRSLGISREHCINMYGMTELSTQFYDSGNETVPSVKSGPFWIRTRVVNPLTGEDVPRGERGVLVHCDLANFNSVTTILTEDMGMEKEDGFLLLGRAKGVEARGCSIAVDEFIQATKGMPS